MAVNAVVSARLACSKCSHEVTAQRLPDGYFVVLESCKCASGARDAADAPESKEKS